MFDSIARVSARYFPLKGYCLDCQQRIQFTTNRFLCASCLEKLPYFQESATCFFCNEPHPFNHCVEKSAWGLESPSAVFFYHPPVSRWLLSFKYHGNYLAGRLLRALFLNHWEKTSSQYPQFDWVLPMPMNYWRAVRGGVNVSAYFAASLRLPVANNLVRKQSNAPRQMGKNRREREQLQKKNFLLVSQQVAGKNLLVIDDVCTTGATIKNCATALKKAGAKKVFFLCLCRDPLD